MQTMDAAVAINIAIDYLKIHKGDENVDEAILRLQSILEQRGCEHLEGDGTLTNLIDIVIDG